MKVQVNHYGRVRDGKIIWYVPELYAQQLIELEGKDIVVTLKKKHEKATLSQYGYYRAAILGACYESEFFSSLDNRDAIHDLYFAPKFLSFKTAVNIGGKIQEITRVKSLADLSVDEMTDFITKVLGECMELGIEVLPSEMYYSKYYNK